MAFDREALYDRLAAHAAADQIDHAELERRTAIVHAAATHEAALAALRGLPPLPAAAHSGGTPRRRRRLRFGRGHGESDGPAGDWRPTAERFRDPRTGRVMRVWEDAGGGRHYVADDA